MNRLWSGGYKKIHCYAIIFHFIIIFVPMWKKGSKNASRSCNIWSDWCTARVFDGIFYKTNSTDWLCRSQYQSFRFAWLLLSSSNRWLHWICLLYNLWFTLPVHRTLLLSRKRSCLLWWSSGRTFHHSPLSQFPWFTVGYYRKALKIKILLTNSISSSQFRVPYRHLPSNILLL